MKKRNVIIALVVITMIGMAVYRGYRMQMSKKIEATGEKKIPVVVSVVHKGDIEETLTFTGDIKGKEEVDVMPRVPGKLIEYKVREGDYVKKNQVIAQIDRDMVGLDFKPSDVNTPIAGVVVKVYLDKGAGVTPPTMSQSMGTPVARVVDLSTVRIIIRVPEREYPNIRLGQAARIKIDAYKDRKFTGRVKTISPMIDQASRTSSVEIDLDNPGNMLKSGMFARVELVVDKRSDVVLINRDAALETLDGWHAYVDKGGVAKKMAVKPGIISGTSMEVLSGVNEGDRLVVVGQEIVFDGAKLNVVETRNEGGK
jgi:multidrug efflux pump subunit AcrA (membrane-fusion protein)